MKTLQYLSNKLFLYQKSHVSSNTSLTVNQAKKNNCSKERDNFRGLCDYGQFFGHHKKVSNYAFQVEFWISSIFNAFKIHICKLARGATSWSWKKIRKRHCLKSIQIRNYFWSVFSCIRDRIWRFTRNNSVFRHFSRSERNQNKHYINWSQTEVSICHFSNVKWEIQFIICLILHLLPCTVVW